MKRSIMHALISLAAVFGLALFLDSRSVALFALVPVLFYLLKNHKRSALSKRGRVCCVLLSLLLTAFCLIGYSIEITGSLILLYENPARMLRTLAGACGYYVSFRCVLSALIALYGRCPSGVFCENAPEKAKGFAACLYRHPFAVSFHTLLILYIPYVVISYPALFMGDTPQILCEFLPTWNLSSHHSVPYALLYYGIVRLGYTLFGSWNAGAFLFALVQLFLILGALSAGIAVLVREFRLSWRWAICLLALYAFHPRISNYMMVATKDTVYGPFLLLFCIALCAVLKKGWTPGRGLRLVIPMLFVLTCRNEGVYILLIAFLTLLIFRPSLRRQMLTLLVACLSIQVLLTRVLFPAFSITPGSRRELLAIPIQTTGRLAMTHADDLSPEERDAILGVFDVNSLEEIADIYTPDFTDHLKLHFTTDTSSPEFNSFLRTWLRLALRYPQTYLTAFLASYDDYFFPYTPFTYVSYWWSGTRMELTNGNAGTDFSHPAQLEAWRTAYEDIREEIFSYVPFSLFNSPGLTTWALLLLLALQIVYRQYDELLLMVPFIVSAMVWFVALVNGYYGRFQYPLLLCLPWLFFLSAANRKAEEMREQE